MFSTILVPVDGSEPSEKALTFALEFAASQRSAVFLCHVPVRSKWQWDDTLRAGRSILDAAHGLADEFGVRAKTVLGTGAPADGIVDLAEREGVDLIVMGRTSAADAVIRQAPVPVVVVGPQAAWIDVSEATSWK